VLLKQFDFYCKETNLSKQWNNPQGEGLANEFELQPDSTVVFDRTTNLIWQKGGSSRVMDFADAEKYIRGLNVEKFAGFSDWRLPTLEETMSLVEPKRFDNRHIDPIFDQTQEQIWTADQKKSASSNTAWVVSFRDGLCADDMLVNNIYYVRAVRSTISLRRHKRGFHSKNELRTMLEKYSFFYCEEYAPYEYPRRCDPQGKGLSHNFIKQRNGKIVFDGTTGLMWQEAGSDSVMILADAERYIRELNRHRFAGYYDWRLPTLEEAMSLMEPNNHNGLHIDPVFGEQQQDIWTVDTLNFLGDPFSGWLWWVVSYKFGYCSGSFFYNAASVRAVR